jgi:hypothetical protein
VFFVYFVVQTFKMGIPIQRSAVCNFIFCSFLAKLYDEVTTDPTVPAMAMSINSLREKVVLA